MNQKLFKQIRNEWRNNIWLASELLVVSVVMWYIVDFVYVKYSVISKPMGFDIEHCYHISIGALTEKSAEFNPDRTDKESIIADKLEIVERIRRRPEIESAALEQNSRPYNGGNTGGDMRVDTFKTTGYSIFRRAMPDFVKVFRYTGVNGESPEQLCEILSQGKVLVSENLFEEFGLNDIRPFVGKRLYAMGDTINGIEIGAIIKTIRYSEHMQGDMNRSVLGPLSPDMLHWENDLCVRVRDNMDHNFIDNLLADADKQLRVGNFYISDVKSFDYERRNYNLDADNTVRNYLIGMGFLLVNIFLGLLGTFWFRTQQRTGDIAVRKVNGATRWQIFRLLTGEGVLLLTIVTPLALIIDFNLAYMELNTWSWYNGFLNLWRLLLCGGIAYVLMAIIIILGIAVPARRAMHIAPAEALRDE